jgi:hypothetical protein
MPNNKLEQLVENFFKPQPKQEKEYTISELLSLIKEVEDTLPYLKEEKTSSSGRMSMGVSADAYKGEKLSDAEATKEMVIKIPTIKITERWGKLREGEGGKDRQIIETFTKNIGGGSVKEKLSNIQTVISEFDPDASIPKILSTIVFLELLRSIVQEYTEAVSGFLFEGFLAGIFGGQSVQITDVSTEEGEGQKGKPITDVVLNGKLYSLKLLSLSTGIHGSFENMVEHMAQYGQIIYLIVRKSDNKGTLQFSEFEITLENFLRYIGFGEEKITKSSAQKETISGSELKQLIGREDIYIQNISTVDGKSLKGAISNPDMIQDEQQYVVSIARSQLSLSGAAKKLYGNEEMYSQLLKLQKSGDKEEFVNLLRQTPGYKKREQWTIPPGYAAKHSEVVGVLDLSEATIGNIATKYSELLQNSLIPIYTKLDEVGTAINNYFLGVNTDETSNKQFAQIAATKSKELAAETDKVAK